MVACIRFSGIENLQKNRHMKNVKQAVVVLAIKQMLAFFEKAILHMVTFLLTSPDLELVTGFLSGIVSHTPIPYKNYFKS